MKRFYSVIATAIVMLVAMTVSAQLNLSEFTKDVDFSAKQKAVTTQMKAAKNVKSIEGVAPKAKASSSVTAADLEGDYTWNYISYLNTNQGANTGSISITATSDTEIDIVGFLGTYPVKATVASDGTVTIPNNQVLFYHTSYNEDVVFYHKVWTADYSGIEDTDEPMIGHYADGILSFNEDDIISIEISLGYFLLADTHNMVKLGSEPEIDDSADWEEVGTADLMDGWILTCYGIDQTENIIEGITVEKSLVEEGVYRLVNPYQNEIYADANSTTVEKGYIKFNIADPAFPYIYNGVKAGFANNNGEFYCYDLNAYFHLIKGYDKSTILGAGVDGLSTFDTKTGVLTIPTAIFGVTSAPNGGYSWQDSEGNPVDMTSSIKLNFWEAPVEPTTDQIDFIARNYPTSNSSHDGDITETTTFESDNELFTATVTVSDKSTANRFWTASGGSQLRIYGGSVTIDGKGKEIIQVKLSGAQLDNKGATRSPSYTINDLDKEGIIAAGGSISATEAIWVGSSDKVVIEHTYAKENLQINSITVTFAPVDADANLEAAQADMAQLEDLQAELTEFLKGKEDYITPDLTGMIETLLGDTYMTMIQEALDKATENGTEYVSPIDWDDLSAKFGYIMDQIEGIMNGTIALYTEKGVVTDGTINKAMPFFNTPVDVDVYANNSVVIKGWDGVEGSDLKVVYANVGTLNEEGESRVAIIGLEQTVDGEVVSVPQEDDEDGGVTSVTLFPQAGKYVAFDVQLGEEMTSAMVGKDDEIGMGVVSLYGAWYPKSAGDDETGDNMGVADAVAAHYMVQWPAEPVEVSVTLAELVTMPETESVKVELTDAKVTAAFDMEDYIVAFVEDETAAIQVYAEEIEAGKTLTGVITGSWSGEALMLIENNTVATDADVKQGFEIVEPNELLEASNLNRLVTVNNSKMCPIVNEDGMVMVGNTAVYDVFYQLGDEYEFPEAIKSVTGVLVPMMGQTVLVPRSTEDVVAATPEVETTSYIVSWESDMNKANSVTTTDGVKVQITGNESKEIQSGNAITLPDGTTYTGMKVSNGAQNTITLPEGMVATQVTFYSYVNKSSADIEGARTSYWKEVDGVTYTEETASIMTCPNNKPVETPDVATFAIDKKNSFTYTNAGEQVVYVAIIEAVNVATGISNTVVYNNANGAIFNLAGQKVSENYKGIVIKNGKKILVK